LSAVRLLETVPLFEGMPHDERYHLAQLMFEFHLPAGSLLFKEGDPGDRLYVIESGLLHVTRPAAGGTDLELAALGAGAILGEMSLMGSGKRTATVVAVDDTRGWMLDRAVFDVLRTDIRRGSRTLMGRLRELALERLRSRYEAIARSLGEADVRPEVGPPQVEEVDPAPGELAHLRSTLFFSHLSEEEITGVVDGVRRLHVDRAGVLVGMGQLPPALYLVVWGAIETTVRAGGQAQRARLAGPGRAVGHLGVLDTSSSVIECRARERAILLELPWERVRGLLDGVDPAARGFAAAFSVDVVRALHQAERPMSRMIAAAHPASVAEYRHHRTTQGNLRRSVRIQ
jgi:CRP-like cAMP-binding protein